MKRDVEISDYLKPLGSTPAQAYLTNALQVADVLDWILHQVGKAKVLLTSFSISEEFLRRLYFVIKGGRTTEMTLLLDHTATQKTLKLWAFMANVIDRVYLADNHSKLLLVESMSGDKVAVITSQNLTRGNRNECAFITTDAALYDRLHSQATDLINNHSVLLNDLYRRAIEEN